MHLKNKHQSQSLLNGDIPLLSSCKKNYVNMQYDYVDMQQKYVDIQDDYVHM